MVFTRPACGGEDGSPLPGRFVGGTVVSRSRKSKPDDAEIPQFCDFHCPHADFPPADTAGICRTMSAVQCTLLGELVNKNAACEWRKRGRPASRRG